MKKNVIVSLADANYFPLLEELINSIKQFKDSESVAICILDAGLTEQQKKKLSNKVDEIKSAEWDIEVPEYKIKGKQIQICLSSRNQKTSGCGKPPSSHSNIRRFPSSSWRN